MDMRRTQGESQPLILSSVTKRTAYPSFFWAALRASIQVLYWWTAGGGSSFFSPSFGSFPSLGGSFGGSPPWAHAGPTSASAAINDSKSFTIRDSSQRGTVRQRGDDTKAGGIARRGIWC